MLLGAVLKVFRGGQFCATQGQGYQHMANLRQVLGGFRDATWCKKCEIRFCSGSHALLMSLRRFDGIPLEGIFARADETKSHGVAHEPPPPWTQLDSVLDNGSIFESVTAAS